MADLHMADTIGETDVSKNPEMALQKAYQSFGNRASFRGVDIGYRWRRGQRTDEICLRLHVQRKLPLDALLPSQVLPSHVDGIALDVIEAAYQPSLEPGSARPQDMTAPYTMGGLACGRSGEGAGTIGLMVIDTTTGKPGILSNWHVLAGPRARRNDPILQLGDRNDAFDPRNHIANLKRWMLDRSGDAAFAELLPDQPWLPVQFGGFDSITNAGRADLGDLLTKTSQSADSASARVDGRGLYRLQYETRPGQLEYRDIEGVNLIHEPQAPELAGRLSSAGDSGSAWISTASGTAAALQIGGQIMHDAGPLGTSTGRPAQGVIACDMAPILDRLELRLAGFKDLLAQNGQSAVLTRRQRSYASLCFDADERAPSPLWPHPRHWADARPPHPAEPEPPRPERRTDGKGLDRVKPVVRILPNGRAPVGLGQEAASHCFALREEIWQNRLYPALLDYDANFHGVFAQEPLTRRIAAADERNMHDFFARLINGSAHFRGIGLKQFLGSDFRGVRTYMQICDRIDALRPRF